jgi:hypothetical protein
VFGVAHDDVLNVRAAPGSGNSVILRLSPIEDGVAASGTSRLLAGTSLWYEVEARGVTGWAAAEFLLYRGPTKDLTSYVVGQAGGYPEASSMPELGQLVASTLADPRSRIVMSVGPSVGDLGQVTYDVVGLGDGSVGGLRVTVLGQPAEGGGQFSLKSVEATDFCLRGGSPSQRCA